MIYLNSDYTAGGHPEVMRRLVETNSLHTVGYGDDPFTLKAKRLILKECGLPSGEVFFLVGGTQTNSVVIDRLLGRNDGVITADTSHIEVHEAGAIEFSGHKILSLKGVDGKLKASDIDSYLSEFYKDDTHPHMVRPAMVYISFPTEMGTLYTREELKQIHELCVKWDIPLYIDGARMAYGLAASEDLSLKDLSLLCDAFYLGGTKCGALFGEAVVTSRPELFERFFSLMKMHGALLAKGRLLGVQFETLFENGLYYRIGIEAVRHALRLKEIFSIYGWRPCIDSPTNQQFFTLPNEVIQRLREEVSFDSWGPKGNRESTVRFVTDWTTTTAELDRIETLLLEIKTKC